MASKKILLEVLTADRSRVAPASPRPKKEKEERRREKRASRPISLPHPTTQSLLLVLGCVVAIVAAYGFGFWQGRSGESTPQDISTKAADPMAEVDDERPPAQPMGQTPPRSATGGPRWVVQLVSYDLNPRNEELAIRTRTDLAKLGLPDVGAFEFKGKYIVTAGSFPSKDDPALAALLERVKGMPFGKEKAPFAEARVRDLQ